MDLTNYPIPHTQVAARVVDGQAVIVLADTGEVQILNAVGTRIWELIDGTRNLAGIIAAIESEFEVSSQEAQRDVEDFVQSLVDGQVLVLQERPGSLPVG
jgi:hypothetical protein